jgi:hypothetical protein
LADTLLIFTLYHKHIPGKIDNLIKKYQTNEKALEVFLGAGKKAA